MDRTKNRWSTTAGTSNGTQLRPAGGTASHTGDTAGTGTSVLFAVSTLPTTGIVDSHRSDRVSFGSGAHAEYGVRRRPPRPTGRDQKPTMSVNRHAGGASARAPLPLPPAPFPLTARRFLAGRASGLDLDPPPGRTPCKRLPGNVRKPRSTGVASHPDAAPTSSSTVWSNTIVGPPPADPPPDK